MSNIELLTWGDMNPVRRTLEASMREDFDALPPRAQAKMLDLLRQVDPDRFGWWFETLAGEMPDAAPAVA